MKKLFNSVYHQIDWWIIILLFVSLIPLFALASPAMFIAHDSEDHVARIANFYLNIKEGNFIPRWAGNLNWGYGHPILMFLYPLPSYLASLFIAVGFSFVGAAKLVYLTGFVGSGLTMFLWIRRLWGNYAAFLSAILYMFAPYRFVDLYVRGAIGENFFFIFPPLVCYFLLFLVTSNSKIGMVGGAVSLAGMILSHNALTLMFLPFIFCYATILLIGNKIHKLRAALMILATIILGFGLSSFFLVPAFFEGKYTLRDIVVKNEIFNRFESFSRLLYSPWKFAGSGEFSVQVGIVQWLIIVAALFYLVRFAYNNFEFRFKRLLSILNTDYLLVLLCFVFFWIAILMTLSISKPLYQFITTLQKFQFPWRWLSLAIFSPAVLGGFFISRLKFPVSAYVAFIVVVLSILLSKNHWQPKAFVERPDSYYSGIYEGTTDTGESAPIWSVRFMLSKPKAYAEIAEGEGNIHVVSRTSTRHMYQVEVTTEQALFVENTLYFPGWFVSVDQNTLAPQSLGFHNPTYRGLINFRLTRGIHTITVAFRETKLRLFADTISIFSGIIVMVISVARIRYFERYVNSK